MMRGTGAPPRGLALVAALTALASTPAGVVAQSHAAAPAEVPLRVVSGKLVAEVRASDGTALDFIVSTGNGVTVVTASVAARLGPRPELLLGSVTLDPEAIHEIADDDLVIGGTQLDGIVGANTLNRYDVLLDAPGGRLLLAEVGPRPAPWEGVGLGDPVRLRIFHGLAISLDATLAGESLPATLDTGSSPMLVNAAAAARVGIETEGEVEFALGAISLGSLPLRVADNALLQRWDPTGAGFAVLGAPMAYDCALAISWVHRELRTCR